MLGRGAGGGKVQRLLWLISVMKLYQVQIVAWGNLPKMQILELICVAACVVAKSNRSGHLKKLLGVLLLRLG